MAIQWGPYDGHLRCGISYTIVPSNPTHADTTVKVTFKYYVDSDGWSFADPETLHTGCTGWGPVANDFYNGSSGSQILVATHSETYAISSDSGTKTASCNLTGAYNGATPSQSITVQLPNRPDAPVTPPSAGEDVTATATGPTTASATWNPPNDDGGAAVDNYEYQVSKGSGFATPIYDQNTGGAQSASVTGLSPSTHYYSRVRAHNSAGWGDWTLSNYGPAQFTTAAGTPTTPGTPAQTRKTQTSLTVGWTPSDSQGGGTVTYTVRCATDPGMTSVVSTQTTPGTSQEFDGLTPDTPYYFDVLGTNSAGDSPRSAVGTGQTLPSLVYNDTGDFATLLGNLANAVGDKMVRLGGYIYRGITVTQSVAIGANNTITTTTDIMTDSRPDKPTFLGSGTSDIQINYPGQYLIELFIHINKVSAANAGNGVDLWLYVNGTAYPTATNPKGGQIVPQYVLPDMDNGGFLVTVSRHLEAGDTIGYGLHNQTLTSVNIGANATLIYPMSAKVTLIGF